MSQLEGYLDQAYRSGSYVEVTVVHGLGTGALREGTHKILGKLPYVKTFRDGGAGHGGSGATVVEFDRD
jgi:DNA mismatch repair protein MutS2